MKKDPKILTPKEVQAEFDLSKEPLEQLKQLLKKDLTPEQYQMVINNEQLLNEIALKLFNQTLH